MNILLTDNEKKQIKYDKHLFISIMWTLATLFIVALITAKILNHKLEQAPADPEPKPTVLTLEQQQLRALIITPENQPR